MPSLNPSPHPSPLLQALNVKLDPLETCKKSYMPPNLPHGPGLCSELPHHATVPFGPQAHDLSAHGRPILALEALAVDGLGSKSLL